uniref:M23 family metallopeptidase n=1 Tax=Microbacterium sp. B24 TaxID=95616 RepID=UPI00055C12C7
GSRAVYTKGYHRGEDIANNAQVADIPALRSGEVIDSGRSSVIGFWVCIKPDADPSRRDIYCHMFEPSAKRSGRVNAGDIIGRMATWGESPGTGWTGPHLHFVVSDLSDGGHNTSRADFDPRPIITAALANGGNAPAPAPAPAASGGQVFMLAAGAGDAFGRARRQLTRAPHMPQTPVAGTCTKQSGQSTASRSGMIGAGALRGAAEPAAARVRRARSGAAAAAGAIFAAGL